MRSTATPFLANLAPAGQAERQRSGLAQGVRAARRSSGCRRCRFPSAKDEVGSPRASRPFWRCPSSRLNPARAVGCPQRVDQLDVELGGPAARCRRRVFGHFAPERPVVGAFLQGSESRTWRRRCSRTAGAIEPVLSRSLREHISGFTALNAGPGGGRRVRGSANTTIGEPDPSRIPLRHGRRAGRVASANLVLAGRGDRGDHRRNLRRDR